MPLHNQRNNNKNNSNSRMACRGNTSRTAKKSWTTNQMKEDIVAAINRYRSMHKVSPLVRNPKIEREHSDRWAKEIVKTDEFTHSDDEKYGENIYAGELNTASDPVDVWYWECKFDWADPERSLMAPGCGHFTAMIWKETTEVGIGICPYDEDGTYIVVASFWPPGNVIGHVAKNVIRPRGRVTRRRANLSPVKRIERG